MPEIFLLLVIIAVLAFVWRFFRDETPAAKQAPARPERVAAAQPKTVAQPKTAVLPKKNRKQRRAEKAAALAAAAHVSKAAAVAKAPAIALPPPSPKVQELPAPLPPSNTPPPQAPPKPAPKVPAAAAKAPPLPPPPPLAPAKNKAQVAKKTPPKAPKPPSDPTLIKGTCIEVVDGDTLVYRDDHRRVRKLRLKGIDSPEYRPLQDHGAEAKQALAGKVDGRRIEVRVLEVDQHGRDLGTVFFLGRNINEELVAEGHAWNFAYRSDPAHFRLYSLERQAKSGRKGLWLGQRPIHPKDFRARNRF